MRDNLPSHVESKLDDGQNGVDFRIVETADGYIAS